MARNVSEGRRIGLVSTLASLGPDRAFLVSLLCLVLLSAVDYGTGLEVSFSVFYLVPVSITAWNCGLVPSIGMSLLAAVMWEATNRLEGMHYDMPWVEIWNPATRFVFYVVVSYLLDQKRQADILLEKLSSTDPLTGLANRRVLAERLDAELHRQQRTERPLAVAIVDIDHFKTLNDRFGHVAGDAALKTVAEVLESGLRRTDLAARLGGDEFALVLPETDGPQSEALVARLREALLAAMRARGWPVTFSIGVAFGVAPIGTDGWLKAADELMYEVKHGGRDAVRTREVGDVPTA
jgi:diguanylate cyclase (GGDEF)-like protein